MDETQQPYAGVVSGPTRGELQQHQKLSEGNSSAQGYLIEACGPDECAAGEPAQMIAPEVVLPTLMLACVVLIGILISWSKRKNPLDRSFDDASRRD